MHDTCDWNNGGHEENSGIDKCALELWGSDKDRIYSRPVKRIHKPEANELGDLHAPLPHKHVEGVFTCQVVTFVPLCFLVGDVPQEVQIDNERAQDGGEMRKEKLWELWAHVVFCDVDDLAFCFF